MLPKIHQKCKHFDVSQKHKHIHAVNLLVNDDRSEDRIISSINPYMPTAS